MTRWGVTVPKDGLDEQYLLLEWHSCSRVWGRNSSKVLMMCCNLQVQVPQNPMLWAKNTCDFSDGGGIIHPNTISLYWFIDQPLIFDPSNDVWSWSHLDPGSWGTQVHQLCQRPNLEDGLPTGDLLVITMVNHDHHPLGAHPLRVVGGRLPEGLGNLRDEISRWQSGGLIRIDSGQICIIPKPECFGHLGGRFPY